MTRIRPEYLDPETPYGWLTADIIVAEEDEEDGEEEEEEEDRDEIKDDEDDEEDDGDEEGYSVIRNGARPALVTKSGLAISHVRQ